MEVVSELGLQEGRDLENCMEVGISGRPGRGLCGQWQAQYCLDHSQVCGVGSRTFVIPALPFWEIFLFYFSLDNTRNGNWGKCCPWGLHSFLKLCPVQGRVFLPSDIQRPFLW